jgi:hypothetical protein
MVAATILNPGMQNLIVSLGQLSATTTAITVKGAIQ